MSGKKYKCEICKDKGFLFSNEENPQGFVESVARPCECRKETDKKILLNHRMKKSGIPKIYKDLTQEKFYRYGVSGDFLESNKESLRELKEIADSGRDIKIYPRVIWIWGESPNLGKTTWLVILAKKLMESRLRVRFVTMNGLLDILTEKYHPDQNEDSLQKKPYSLDEADVLVIDDMFRIDRTYKKPGAEFSVVGIYNLLNDFLSEDKTIICTSNISIHEVNETYKQSLLILLRNYKEIRLDASYIM